ncbi:MAG: OsmC family protein [Balneolaceae bacterium]|nr:OsmC family protein [Balneolaceae bacterium]
MKQPTIINGVNVDRLVETIETITEQPELGKFEFRAKSKWVDGGHYMTEIDDFYGAGREDAHDKPYILYGDEPDILLGLDKGPNPVEFILHGLAGCLSTTFVYYAAAEGVTIDAISYTLEGDIDIRGLLGITKKVRPGYQNIRVTFHVKSDAPTEKLQELVKLAQMRSPVFNTVSEPVPVDVNLEHAAAVA